MILTDGMEGIAEDSGVVECKSLVGSDVPVECASDVRRNRESSTSDNVSILGLKVVYNVVSLAFKKTADMLLC